MANAAAAVADGHKVHIYDGDMLPGDLQVQRPVLHQIIGLIKVTILFEEGMTEEEPDAVLENWSLAGEDLSKTPITEMVEHYHWINPAFKDRMISDAKGGIASKTLYGLMRKDGSDAMRLAVYYEVETGTVIAWEYDVD